MNKHVISCKWIENLKKDIVKYCQQGDCVNCWGIPTVGSSTYLKKLKAWPQKPKNLQIIYIDTHTLTNVSPQNFYNLINTEIKLLNPKLKLQVENLDPQQQAISFLSKLTESKKICIIIYTMEDLKTLDDKFLSSVKSIRDRFFGNICFIFSSIRPLYEDSYFKKFPFFIDFTCHKEITVTPISSNQYREAELIVKKAFKITLPSKQIQQIIKISGGYFGLFKTILRIQNETPNKNLSINDLLNNSIIDTRLGIIFSTFTEEEKSYLISLANKEDNITEIKSRYLQASGIISENKINGNLFKEYLKKLKIEKNQKSQIKSTKVDLLKIDSNTGEIYEAGKRTGSILSDTELKIIKLMKESKDTICTRDSVAHAIWGESLEEKYSDWAIDKAISRIRKKIGDNRHPNNYILTVKGKGFISHI
ncbi:winged helix-turn-helix transcriptional regulator [Candidatus Dojkabacteria bacterium]|nr:winged helix-turn-helix transcriptional regulator [Candidatus Dojkabacteria bacterium]